MNIDTIFEVLLSTIDRRVLGEDACEVIEEEHDTDENKKKMMKKRRSTMRRLRKPKCNIM